MSSEVRCADCGKVDERKVTKPLCLACFETQQSALRGEQTARASIRREMRSARLHEMQLERWLTGRWPIVAPR